MDDGNRESGDSHKKGGAGTAEDPSISVSGLENVSTNEDHVENKQSCPIVEEQRAHKALEDAGLQESLALKESAHELQGHPFKFLMASCLSLTFSSFLFLFWS